MDWFRLRHTIKLMLTLDALKRADYIREKRLFHHMGNNCMVMFRKLPLYPRLISFGDNVWIASNVNFCTHDVIHRMLNNKYGKTRHTEKIGCIEIGDNVFIGTNTTILYDTKIASDTIIGAGSLVNKSITGGVWAGVPVRYICSLEEYEKKRKNILVGYSKMGIDEETEQRMWMWFKENDAAASREL